MPNHHPDQFLLSDFAAGSTNAAVALPVAVHLEHCAKCRNDTNALTAVGSNLFADLDSVPVSDNAFQQTLEAIDKVGSMEDAAQQTQQSVTNADVPRALQALIPGDLEQLTWQRLGSSLRVARLTFGDRQHEVALHHIRADGQVANHGHRGNEITVVLRGGFSDADGDYRAGDFMWRTADEVHQPAAWKDSDCLCLSVLDAPIRVEGWLGWLINPFVRLDAR